MKTKIENGYLYLYFNPNRPELEYHIPLNSLDDIWNVALIPCGDNSIYLENLSRWVIHFMNKGLSKEILAEIISLIQKIKPANEIDWNMTQKAIEINETYGKLMAAGANESKPFLNIIATAPARILRRINAINEIKAIYNI